VRLPGVQEVDGGMEPTKSTVSGPKPVVLRDDDDVF